MKILDKLLLATALVAASIGATQAQMVDKKALTLEAAMKIAAAAEAEAAKNNWNVCVSIVDEGGHLVLLHKRDNTQFGSIDVSIQKAHTAAGFKRPTKVFEDAIAGGRTAILGIEEVLPLEGGLPLVFDGQVVGAIGVSGATSQQDGQVAKAGADALLTQQ
ncbi:MAG: heme-binding protein [Betaproteobacteria bacterium]